MHKKLAHAMDSLDIASQVNHVRFHQTALLSRGNLECSLVGVGIHRMGRSIEAVAEKWLATSVGGDARDSGMSKVG